MRKGNDMTTEDKKRKKGIAFWLGASAVPAFSTCAYLLLMTLNSQGVSTETQTVKPIQPTQSTTLRSETTIASSSVNAVSVDEVAPAVVSRETTQSTTLPQTNEINVTTTKKVVRADEQPSTTQVTQQSTTTTGRTTTTTTTTQSTTVAVNKEELRRLLRDAASRQASDYSPSSWQALQNVLPNANQVEQNQNVTQEQVDDEVAKLRQALAGLTVDKIALQHAVSQAKTYPKANYSPSSWNHLAQVLSQAQATLANPNAIQAQVDTMTQQLNDAIAGLTVDKAALKRLIDTTPAYIQSAYAPATWQPYASVLAQANEIFANPNATQAQVDAALARLLNAINGLGVDKAVLKRTLDTAKTYVATDYSPASFVPLQQAITSADAVYNNPRAIQQEIDAAHERLNRAIAGLAVDKVALQQKLTQAGAVIETDYSPASYNNLQTIKQNAQAVFDNPNATQSEVNAATTALANAIQQLAVDKTALQQAITQAQSKVESEYTTASFATFQEALTNAQNVLANTTAKQSEVNAALAQLTTAMAQLERLKARPGLTLTKVTKKDLQRQVDVTYTLENPQNTFVSAVVKVYKGTDVVKTVNVVDGTSASITDLDWGVDYELETVMTYNVGNGNLEHTFTQKVPVRLSPKSVTMTQAAQVNLVELNADGSTRTINALEGVPTDLSRLYAHYVSDTYKDVFLPIDSIEPVTANGVTNYKVVVKDSAITHFNTTKETYEATYTFVVTGKKPAENNVYYDFDELVAAMNATPNGTFYIGRDMSAKAVSLPTASASYVTNTFTGTLSSDPNATTPFKITDLERPLFNQLDNATITNVNLSNIAIDTTQTGVGALAKSSTGRTKVSNVLAEGYIKAAYNIGGLVYEATGSESQFTNVGFVGTITATQTMENNQYVGGLLGKVQSVDVISSFFDGTLTGRANGTSSRIGGLVGGGDNWHTEIKQSYVKGTINNIGTAGQVGGIIGSSWFNARAYNNVVYANVIKGNKVHGDKGYQRNEGIHTNYIVTGVTGDTHPRTTDVSIDEANEKVATYNVSVVNQVTPTVEDTRLTSVPGYDATKAIAYYNAQRLTPFYNAHFVVEQGNLLSGTLTTKRIQKIVPMVANQFVPNIVNEWGQVNKLFVVFEDGTTEMIGIQHHSVLPDTNIVEYKLNGSTVVYTPEQFKVDLADVLAPLENVFNQLDYLGPEMYAKFNMNAYDGTDTWDNHRLLANFEAGDTEEVKTAKKRRYLLEAMGLQANFDKIKANIVEELSRVIGANQVANWSKEQVAQWVRANVEPKAFEILFGLAYMDRWYNVSYGEYNIKDLMKYSPDFTHTQNTDTVNVLTSIPNNEFRGNLTQRTDSVYASRLSSLTGKANVVEFLSYFNAQLGTKSDAEWFKESSKAIIREYQSNEVPDADVSTFKKLSSGDLQRMLLPLLTLSDNSIYVVTNIATVNIGMVETYVNLNWKDTKPEVYKQQMDAMIARLEKYGDLQRDHFDMWHRLSNANVKDKLIKERPILNWSNMQVGVFNENTNQRTSMYWSPAAGEKASLGMKEFLTAVGQWTRNNGLGAFANGADIYFVAYEPWSDFGNSVFSHEAVHNLDGSVYLGGFGRRDGMGAEAYATGMMQGVERPNYEAYGLNFVNDYSTATNRLHNATMEQFQTVADVDTYFKNQFEVLHTLTAIEMEAITKLTADQQRVVLGKIAPDATTPTTERYRQFTNEEWDQLRQGKTANQATFETLADLVNAQALYFYGNRSDIRNGYGTVDLFQGVYGVPEYTQTNGAGVYTFKKMAFELWAEYGYQNGFIGYTSNQLKTTAAQQGQTFNDNFIIKQLSNNQYNTINEFKVATYEKALQNADNIQPFSFVWTGTTYQITNKADLQAVFARAIAQDIAAGAPRSNDNLRALKRVVYTALFNQTNEFRNSIYR